VADALGLALPRLIAMPPRAAALIRSLGLAPHPEGGYFREVFRTPAAVAPGDGRPPRPAMTTIYFLLTAGQYSRLHRLVSDEVWHFYEGDPLDLFCVDAALMDVQTLRLGPVGEGTAPVAVIPAGAWQAARTQGAYTLAGCTEAPGFVFEDFAFLHDDPERAETLRRRHAALVDLL
jgi:uncharacterized protein